MSNRTLLAIVALASIIALYFIYTLTDTGGIVGDQSDGRPDPNMPVSGQNFGAIPASKVYQLAYAIARAEGFYSSGSVPQQANNPGDLELGSQGQGTIGGKTIFASVQNGWEALYNETYLMLSGKSRYYGPSQTFAQAGLTYSGGDPNWSANVAATLSVDQSTTLGDWLAS